MPKNFWKLFFVAVILAITLSLHPVQEFFGFKATSLNAQIQHIQNTLSIKSENNQDTFLIAEEYKGVEYFSLHKRKFGSVVIASTLTENNFKVLYFESTGEHKYIGGFTLDTKDVLSIPRTRKANIYWLEIPEETAEPIPSTVLLLVDSKGRGLGTSDFIQKGQKSVAFAEIKAEPALAFAFNQRADITDLGLVLRK